MAVFLLYPIMAHRERVRDRKSDEEGEREGGTVRAQE
jgi:hypothetical protein